MNLLIGTDDQEDHLIDLGELIDRQSGFDRAHFLFGKEMCFFGGLGYAIEAGDDIEYVHRNVHRVDEHFALFFVVHCQIVRLEIWASSFIERFHGY